MYIWILSFEFEKSQKSILKSGLDQPEQTVGTARWSTSKEEYGSSNPIQILFEL